MSINEARMPILVACGQITERDKTGTGSTPVELMEKACLAAAEDAASHQLLESVTQIAATGLTVDADQVKTPLSRAYRNVPKTVANRLKINPQEYFYVATGGNSPQYLVNHFAEQISLGHAETVLLVGGETLATMKAKFNRWYKWLLPKGEWRDDPGGQLIQMGDARASCSRQEAAHGLELPANVYPLFENALQHHYQRSFQKHRLEVGELFSGFSEIAAQNPFAWFQKAYTAGELTTPSESNRMIAYPYTKLLNSMISVNQSAAVVLTSVEKAKQLGISEDKWVYLHGCADGNDIWNVTERVNYHSSPAMRKCGQEALAMAGQEIDSIQHLDLYSCFPSAVQIARDEFGIGQDDQRQLSLTGGLPYFGGPGNSYSMFAIAEMMQRLRANPNEYGLLNANGWFITKHSVGVYSTKQPNQQWQRQNPADYQTEIIAEQGPDVVEAPEGVAEIETFTVVFGRDNQPKQGIVIGRDQQQRRFIANTPSDIAMMTALCDGKAIGKQGRVSSDQGKNVFSLTE